ncbi:MAG TPA: SIS domain-containing protein, partial [Longimicrobiales bacterium]|nr:SIS domain-containing protein [Longimicrobiales bacterium]
MNTARGADVVPAGVEVVRESLEELASLARRVAEEIPEEVARIAGVVTHALASGRKILLCGNGGSAADAQHLAAELVVRFRRVRRALPAVALTTDTSILTAGANDFGFEEVFARQVEALGQEGDVLV